jgi:hypothetical protein
MIKEYTTDGLVLMWGERFISLVSKLSFCLYVLVEQGFDVPYFQQNADCVCEFEEMRRTTITH